eukprot:CAMPEP_0176489402 /NCGR_PEP_ID=MMETSP0200_2-20121128/7264_1 /TAXON_ID=947934 /ORGANISM="Chaetoceros sp., Strain GSL56" /LENGTH=413 /DNA_ID=CAMNT_0017886531 /DNA_START=109 /DNA_END=1350 /DNA_ORIENTATION=-
MKFKAKLSVPHTQLLYNLVNPLSKLQSHSQQYSSSGIGSNALLSSSNASSSLSSSTILYLDDDKLVFSTRGSSYKNDSDGIFCFAELITTNGIFNSHVIQSLEADNAILMELSLLQFKTALKGVLSTQKESIGNSISGAASSLGSEVIIKLAKRNGGLPHLCFEVRDPLTTHHNRIDEVGGVVGGAVAEGIGVNYAVPVRIMKVVELQYHVPPRLGMPDVQLMLPKDRPIRNVVERLRGISPYLYMEGNMKGILTLRIDSDGGSIRISLDKLVPIHEDCKSSQGNGPGHGKNSSGSQTQSQTQNSDHQEEMEQDDSQQPQDSHDKQKMSHQHTQTTQPKEPIAPARCTVKVDSKKLHASLHWQATLGIRDVSSAVLCMWENEMLVLDVTLNPEIGRFMYYIPVHYVSSDDVDP